MAAVAALLSRIKSKALETLGGAERVNGFFRRAGHVWRDRSLDPATTLELFLIQILNGNTAITHLTHLVGQAINPSSYCEARKRLPVGMVAGLADELCGEQCKDDPSGTTWRGHDVVVADATSASLPDVPALQDRWPQPGGQRPGVGFPVVKLLGLLHLTTGLIRQLSIMSLHVHEMSQAAGLAAGLRAGSVLLADRGFCSYWQLALVAGAAAHAVCRTHQKQIVDFAPGRPHRAAKGSKARRGKGARAKPRRGVPTSRFVKRLGREDQVVEWVRPGAKPRWMTDEQFAQTPGSIRLRELRYHIVARGMRTKVVTITTTLLDPVRYPKREIAKLYGLRWQIETNFRHLKITMKMDQLKCQTVDGVLKELMMFVLVYNLVRAAMVLAADHQGVDPNRISFIDTLRRLQSLCNRPPILGPIPLIVNPARPGRQCPRVLKRRKKEYDLMNKPRGEYAETASDHEVMD